MNSKVIRLNYGTYSALNEFRQLTQILINYLIINRFLKMVKIIPFNQIYFEQINFLLVVLLNIYLKNLNIERILVFLKFFLD